MSPPVKRPPPPPPPPPPEDDEDVGAKTFRPAGGPARAAVTVAGGPDRMKVSFNLKYGLDNFGSVGFEVGMESSAIVADRGDPARTFQRIYENVAREFNLRDLEVRRALGKRITDKPANMNEG